MCLPWIILVFSLIYQAEFEVLDTMSVGNEQYQCRFPKMDDDASKQLSIDSYAGPTVAEILDTFMTRTPCSYRVSVGIPCM